ncbi:hypothetical protein Slin14017_G040920 [Septoria linicola]|nr:hypothetical protein Slin14017_G040920 [Septoria linicola]
MARTIARPRKRTTPEPEFDRTQPPPAKRSHIDDGTHFPFLKLPRELRDEVYRHAVESEHSTTLENRNLVTKSGLVGVNDQICEEFLDAVLFYAPVITTTVRNHNFAHVVTFLNRLSEAQLTRLKSPTNMPSTLEDPQRRRRIRINLVYSATKQSSRPQLTRWLDRFNDSNRRGAEIAFEYCFDGTTWQKGGAKQRPHIRTSASDRSNEKVTKMLQALRAGNGNSYGYCTLA